MVISMRCTSGCATIGLIACAGAAGRGPAGARAHRRAPAGGALGDADALHADAEPRIVHHREHAGEAAVLLADRASRSRRPRRRTPSCRSARRACRACARGRRSAGRCAPRAAVRLEQELRHQEQRDAARAGRRIGQPRQHEMDDVVGEIVLAVGDVDLLAGDAVAAVAGAARRACAARSSRSRPAARSGSWCRSIRPRRAWRDSSAFSSAGHAPSSASTAPGGQHRAEREGQVGARSTFPRRRP